MLLEYNGLPGGGEYLWPNLPLLYTCIHIYEPLVNMIFAGRYVIVDWQIKNCNIMKNSKYMVANNAK